MWTGDYFCETIGPVQEGTTLNYAKTSERTIDSSLPYTRLKPHTYPANHLYNSTHGLHTV